MDTEQITLTVATGVALLAFLPVLPRFMDLLPMLWSGLFRTATCVRIEDSKKIQRSRDTVFLLGLPSFVAIVWRCGLYAPQWLDSLHAPLRLAAVAGVTAVLCLLRTALAHVMPFRRFSAKIRETAVECPKNFWIILTFLLFICALAEGIFNIPQNTGKIITFCSTSALYLGFLVRRFQIFAADSNYLTAILYLCALEILPTALLVTSAVVF